MITQGQVQGQVWRHKRSAQKQTLRFCILWGCSTCEGQLLKIATCGGTDQTNSAYHLVNLLNVDCTSPKWAMHFYRFCSSNLNPLLLSVLDKELTKWQKTKQMFSIFFHLNVSVPSQIGGLAEIAWSEAHSLGRKPGEAGLDEKS